jgi:hypothetical protein
LASGDPMALFQLEDRTLDPYECKPILAIAILGYAITLFLNGRTPSLG